MRRLEQQKDILESKITNLKRKESISLTYLDWFKSLKHNLFIQYHIRLEEEINSFVNAFTDFKYYDFDVHKIVKEYKRMESLRNEIDLLRGIHDTLKKSRDELLAENESLDERKRYSSQSLNTL